MTSTTTSVRLIGDRSTTTSPNARRLLWDAAAKGRASARARVRRLQAKGAWSPTVAAELVFDYDMAYTDTDEGTPERFRYAAARAFVVATLATTHPTAA